MNQYTSKVEKRCVAIVRSLEKGLTTANEIAASTGVSKRAVYRYVERLNDVGYRIRGQAGVGYLLISKRKDALYG